MCDNLFPAEACLIWRHSEITYPTIRDKDSLALLHVIRAGHKNLKTGGFNVGTVRSEPIKNRGSYGLPERSRTVAVFTGPSLILSHLLIYQQRTPFLAASIACGEHGHRETIRFPSG